ncbi:GNAT family acetyltransferase [Pedobacter sp. Leaf216]|uniref:GNAT family N-acetyltransferase n=1 Tax=Pedobacter sp. Leaf216 TaxID=1735684 RepID=UPI0006F37B99|nr:GNAT family N-acetyltransferase [Pedobacter sp. Leaf216]KQM72641.1 GNAT family acetyltransferase [Pedobacter sp. Leaf216]
MENIEIVRATLQDVIKLQQIGKTTFGQTFAELNSEENMQKYLQESFSIEKLNLELSNKDSEIYFAILDNNIIGYLKINLKEAQTEKLDLDALEIERIYVIKEFHGQKVGQFLYQKAIDRAHQICASYVWLGVWEQNERAIGFYTKNGFETFSKHTFWLGDDEQTDLMMKKALVLTSESKS